MRHTAIIALGLFLPLATHAKTLKEIVETVVVPIGNTIIGVLYALAFIFFLFGVTKLFFAEGEEGRKKGKVFAFSGIFGLAVLAAVWGLVNVLLRLLTDFT